MIQIKFFRILMHPSDRDTSMLGSWHQLRGMGHQVHSKSCPKSDCYLAKRIAIMTNCSSIWKTAAFWWHQKRCVWWCIIIGTVGSSLQFRGERIKYICCAYVNQHNYEYKGQKKKIIYPYLIKSRTFKSSFWHLDQTLRENNNATQNAVGIGDFMNSVQLVSSLKMCFVNPELALVLWIGGSFTPIYFCRFYGM